jgi:hypothetical protein
MPPSAFTLTFTFALEGLRSVEESGTHFHFQCFIVHTILSLVIAVNSRLQGHCSSSKFGTLPFLLFGESQGGGIFTFSPYLLNTYSER